MLYFNESNVGINRGIVHENYIPDACKYQTQNRWQPLVASMMTWGHAKGRSVDRAL